MSAVIEQIHDEQTRITAVELAQMPDLSRCELIEGVLVEMSPTGNEHGAIELNVGAELLKFVRQHKLGYVRVGEIGIYLQRDPDTVRAADVVYISAERYAQRDEDVSYLTVAPDLIVEVMSPSDSWSRVMAELRDYFTADVRTVWIVEPSMRQVYVYRSLTDVRLFGLGDLLPGDDILPDLDLPVDNLFVDL